jgi:transcriptional regulator with XRE-family HTH domain
MLNMQVNHVQPVGEYPYPPMETMGDRIRTLREARRLTQEQLGKLVGVSKSAVSQWEDGSTKNIKLVAFLALLEALGTDYEWLVYGAGRGASVGPKPPQRGTVR